MSIIYIYEPRKLGRPRWFNNIHLILKNSLLDMGHKIVTTSPSAEIIIAIQHFPGDMRKESGKKYILYQIEPYISKANNVELYYSFGPDEIWGFDISNSREIYTPLGYHPCVRFVSNCKQDWDISFFGCFTPRRKIFFQRTKYNPRCWSSFDTMEKCKFVARTKINVHINSRVGPNPKGFTCWDRISHFLANDAFFVAEEAYYPLKVPQFDSVKEYDALVIYCLCHPEERKAIAVKMSDEYRAKFDMREILKLRGL